MFLPFPKSNHETFLTIFIFLIVVFAVETKKETNSKGTSKSHSENEDPAVTKLREYIRINTSHPDPDYESGINWLQEQANYFGLEFNLNVPPELQSILLNSHMDVVGVNRAKWTYDPFEAHKDSRGYIFGRGSVDMKGTTIAELEAIRRLKQEGFTPLRTVHVSVIPDEEIGGTHGMHAFVNSPEFKRLNVGFDLDEGEGFETTPTGQLRLGISNGHKSAWQFNITAEGISGHGSLIAPNGTAGQKLNIAISRLMELKASEARKLEKCGVTESDITSVNLVRLGGGIGNNVLPSCLWAVFDMRIRVLPDGSSWNFTDYEKFLNDTCKEAGPGVSYTFIQKGMFHTETVADNTNIWWRTLKDTCTHMKWDCRPIILTPTSDAGYVRNSGISAFGFSLRAPQQAEGVGPIHGDNEAINEKDFLNSIERYMVVIKSVSMVSKHAHA